MDWSVAVIVVTVIAFFIIRRIAQNIDAKKQLEGKIPIRAVRPLTKKLPIAIRQFFSLKSAK